MSVVIGAAGRPGACRALSGEASGAPLNREAFVPSPPATGLPNRAAMLRALNPQSVPDPLLGDSVLDGTNAMFYPDGTTLRSADGSVFYSNGATLRTPAGSIYYPNGTLLRPPTGDLYYPSGSSMRGESGAALYPNGSVLRSTTGTFLYPNGSPMRSPNGTVYYPDGNILRGSTGATYYDNGSPAGPLNVTLPVDNGTLYAHADQKEFRPVLIYPMDSQFSLMVNVDTGDYDIRQLS